jgi:hypothetical protein
VLLGQAPAGVAEEDALDPAGDEHPIAHHKQKVRRARSAAQERAAAARIGRRRRYGQRAAMRRAGHLGPARPGQRLLVGVLTVATTWFGLYVTMIAKWTP